MLLPRAVESNKTVQRGAPYPGHSTAAVLPVVGAEDLKVNVGVGSIVTELQQVGETTHSILKMTNTRIYTDH